MFRREVGKRWRKLCRSPRHLCTEDCRVEEGFLLTRFRVPDKLEPGHKQIRQAGTVFPGMKRGPANTSSGPFCVFLGLFVGCFFTYFSGFCYCALYVVEVRYYVSYRFTSVWWSHS